MQTLDYDYSQQEFEIQYSLIRDYLTTGKEQTKKHCSVLLNGLPGSGKSCYYSSNLNLDNLVIIDTDAFRRFHPRIKEINRLDAENFAERTQSFANAITEKLLQDLSNKYFNLVIEGTLRAFDVPKKTCEILKNRNYRVDLIIVACDAKTAWASTMQRAQEMLNKHEKPRLVPIDKFNYNVNHIVDNAQMLIDTNAFDDIKIIDRNGQILNNDHVSPIHALSEVTNIEGWNHEKEHLEYNFLKFKAQILQKEIESYERH